MAVHNINFKLLFSILIISLLSQPGLSHNTAHADAEPSTPNPHVDPELKKICHKAKSHDLCMTVIEPLLDGKSNASSVLDLAMRLGVEGSREGLESVKKLAGDPGTSPKVAAALKKCQENYHKAIDSYETAIGALPGHDVGTVKGMLNAVITNFGVCEAELIITGGSDAFSDIEVVNLRSLAEISLDIIPLLSQPHHKAHASSPSPHADPDIKKICHKAKNHDLCMTVIEPLLDGKSNASSVLDLAMRLGVEGSREGLESVKKLAGDPGTSTKVATALKKCQENYHKAIDSYQTAIGALPGHDVGTVKGMLNAVITNFGVCEAELIITGGSDAFSDIKIVNLRSFAEISLDIIPLLLQPHR